jgi:hypothetical protein
MHLNRHCFCRDSSIKADYRGFDDYIRTRGYRNGCRACLLQLLMAGLDTIGSTREGLLHLLLLRRSLWV